MLKWWSMGERAQLQHICLTVDLIERRLTRLINLVEPVAAMIAVDHEVLESILEILNRQGEAVTLGPVIGPAVPEDAKKPSNSPSSKLEKGVMEMANLVSSQTAGNKCLVTLHPADKNNNPAPIDVTDQPLAVTSSDATIVSVSDIAADGLSFQCHFLAPGAATVSIDADVDMTPAEIHNLVDGIDFTVVAAGKPEAATLGISLQPSVPEATPIP